MRTPVSCNSIMMVHSCMVSIPLLSSQRKKTCFWLPTLRRRITNGGGKIPISWCASIKSSVLFLLLFVFFVGVCAVDDGYVFARIEYSFPLKKRKAILWTSDAGFRKAWYISRHFLFCTWRDVDRKIPRVVVGLCRNTTESGMYFMESLLFTGSHRD